MFQRRTRFTDLTCSGVMMCAKKNLLKIKGLSEAKVDKIREAASKMTVSLPHTNS